MHGVVGKFHSLADHLVQCVLAGLRLRSDHEERRPRIIFLEDFEDVLRVLAWRIVNCQCNDFSSLWHVDFPEHVGPSISEVSYEKFWRFVDGIERVEDQEEEEDKE